MKNENNLPTSPIRLKSYGFALTLIWIICISVSFQWNVSQKKKGIMDIARTTARISYQKDTSYRKWNTMHSGVYVPVTKETPPNPYIKFPERDIVTNSGAHLTLMNASYMTRQVHEIERKDYKVCGHLTSLKPIRPQNKADEWETRALKAFEKGQKEVSSIVISNKKPYLRLMGPLYTESSCLKCHAEQGYKLGDIRGGLRVSIPMTPFIEVQNTFSRSLFMAHFTLCLLGIAGIWFGLSRLKLQIVRREKAENEVHKFNMELEDRIIQRTSELNESNTNLKIAIKKAEEASEAKSLFLANMGHELRTPISGIITSAELVLDQDLSANAKKFIKTIHSSSNSLLGVINNILNYTKTEQGEQVLQNIPFQLSHIFSNLPNNFFQKGIQKSIDISIEHNPSALELNLIGDSERFLEIFTHILDNATKFSISKPSAIISMAILEKLFDRVQLLFKITDNGIGIDKKYHQLIFEPFVQVDNTSTRKYDGAGMGLALCRQIITDMGGKIWVESEFGKGSTFFFRVHFKLQSSKQQTQQIEIKDEINSSMVEKNNKTDDNPIVKMDNEKNLQYLKSLIFALEDSDPVKIDKNMKQLKKRLKDEELEKILFQIENYEYDSAIETANEMIFVYSNQ